MSAHDVIVGAVHEAIFDYSETDAWPILGDDARAADWIAVVVEAAIGGMSIVELADLLSDRVRQMVFTVDEDALRHAVADALCKDADR